MSNKQDDGLIYYPDSECEKHDNVVTTEPVCLVCMRDETERLRAQLAASEARVSSLEKAMDSIISELASVQDDANEALANTTGDGLEVD